MILCPKVRKTCRIKGFKKLLVGRRGIDIGLVNAVCFIASNNRVSCREQS